MDINNISPYIPTQYVDYSTPDINAVNLNKAEVALQRVTAAANEAINAIKELNAAKIDTAKIVTSLASTDTLSVLSGAIGPVIDQRLTDLLNKYNQLNGEAIKKGTPIINNQIASITLSWDYGGVSGDSLLVTDVSGRKLVFAVDAKVNP